MQIKKNKIESYFLPSSKIIIISFLTLFLFGLFFPYYEYPNDSRGYGLYSMRLAEGNYEFTNEHLRSTGNNEFVPANWIKTSHNTAIPDSMPGIAVLGAIFYIVAGETGLFYLGPIFAICFLIISERIATKFFGPYVGLLTLCFLATNEIFFWVGRGLLTSNIFSTLFIIGFYFLIKFIETKKTNLLLLSSFFLMIPSFFRLNGIIIFPIEIIIISSYFMIKYYQKIKNKKYLERSQNIKKVNSIIRKKDFIKISLSILIPWMIFIGFFMIFNNFYFENPIESIYTATENPRIIISQDNNSDLFDSDRIKKYLNHFLPYPTNRINDYFTESTNSINILNYETLNLNEYFKQILGNHNLGILVLITLIIAMGIGFKQRENKTLLVSISIFIISFIIFYSLNPIATNRQGSGRDMLPLIPFFYMMLSYIIVKILRIKIKNSFNFKKMIFSKIVKTGTLLFLIFIIPTSFFYADYSQIIKNDGLNLREPSNFVGKFPASFDGISKNSIIFAYYQTNSVVSYGAVPFTPSWDKGFTNEHYQKTSDILKQTILKDNEVFIFKNPKLDDEKKFYLEFFANNELILKNHSENFCKIIIKKSPDMNSDKNCFQ